MERNQKLCDAIRAKLQRVQRLGYTCMGEVSSLTSYFSLPKGKEDIRMVYDGTKSGLNDPIWAPWFPLPTIEAHLQAVRAESFMGDIDIADTFLNFVIHPKQQDLFGVDLTPYFSNELYPHSDQTILWEQWTRCGMGFKNSPYNVIQGLLFTEEMIRGSPSINTTSFDGI